MKSDLTAKDVMTHPVFCVAADATIRDAAQIMVRERIGALPVVNGQHVLVGIVTERDMLRRAELGTQVKRAHWLEFLVPAARQAGEYVASHSRKVADVMTRPVAAVTEDTPMGEIAGLMETKNIKRVPVVDGGRVVGMVSQADLVRAIADTPVSSGNPTDAAIREMIEAELDRQPWRAQQGHIVVRDGVVELWGIIYSEADRAAIRVAVENIPGVKAVRDQMVWIEPCTGMPVGLDTAAPTGVADQTKTT